MKLYIILLLPIVCYAFINFPYNIRMNVTYNNNTYPVWIDLYSNTLRIGENYLFCESNILYNAILSNCDLKIQKFYCNWFYYMLYQYKADIGPYLNAPVYNNFLKYNDSICKFPCLGWSAYYNSCSNIAYQQWKTKFVGSNIIPYEYTNYYYLNVLNNCMPTFSKYKYRNILIRKTSIKLIKKKIKRKCRLYI